MLLFKVTVRRDNKIDSALVHAASELEAVAQVLELVFPDAVYVDVAEIKINKIKYIIPIVVSYFAQFDCYSNTEKYIAINYNAVFALAAKENHIPEQLLRAICWVESNHRVKLPVKDDGGSPSYGMCQIKLATARGLGFTGTVKELQMPEYNIHVAAILISELLDKFNGDWKKAATAYNRGVYGAKRAPANNRYTRKVAKAMKEGR